MGGCVLSADVLMKLAGLGREREREREREESIIKTPPSCTGRNRYLL